MQNKTTRAFRTISEAGEELDLQPHVLRFWESKFPEIKPIKRGGGRRFYRPEDIEFLRGIKILLHDEKHPIKDVQKLIRVKGAQRVMDLGRSVERAANPKDIEQTVLVPERILSADEQSADSDYAAAEPDAPEDPVYERDRPSYAEQKIAPEPPDDVMNPDDFEDEDFVDITQLQDALGRLLKLRKRWESFRAE